LSSQAAVLVLVAAVLSLVRQLALDDSQSLSGQKDSVSALYRPSPRHRRGDGYARCPWTCFEQKKLHS
jgi:hypothetical protein